MVSKQSTRAPARARQLDGNLLRLLIVLAAIFVFGTLISPSGFLSAGNLQSIAKQLSEFGLMALGVGICMISGGIDLSSVYVANLCGISAGLFMRRFAVDGAGEARPGFMVLACAVALLIGLACGAFNGFLVAVVKIPPMLATLGTYQLYMGVGIVLSKGSTVSGIPESFSSVGSGMLFGAVPYPFLVFLVAALLLSLLMQRTKFGIRVHLVGTNERSALFSGIAVRSTLIKAYMLSGLMASVAGLLSLSRLSSAKADFGSSYTMQCILTVVLGGVSPDGGFGKIPGIAIGVVILQALSSLLNMFPNISNYFRDILWGVALIFVLILNHTIDRMRRRKMAAKG